MNFYLFISSSNTGQYICSYAHTFTVKSLFFLHIQIFTNFTSYLTLSSLNKMIVFDNKLFLCLMLHFRSFQHSLHLVALAVMEEFIY